MDKAKEQAKNDLTQALSRKDELQKLISATTDESEKQKMINELVNVEADILKKMGEEATSQNTNLQKKLAERRRKREQLAEKQREMKQRQMQELKMETEIMKNAAENVAKRQKDREALEAIIDELKLTVPKEELPYAIQKALDVKHEAELNDMLAKLFEQKCKELQEEIFHLIEQRMQMQNVIIKENQDSLELILDIESKLTGNS